MQERRQPPPSTAFGCLEQMPASVMLDRIPVPFVGVQPDSIIAYVNAAFVELLGYEIDAIVGMAIADVWVNAPAGESAFEALRGRPPGVAELRHAEGYPVKGIFSRSILIRDDDPIAMVAVHDVTEEFWMYGEHSPLPPD